MHTAIPEFPVSLPVMIIWAVILLIGSLLFVHLLLVQSRKGRRSVISLIFLFLLLAGTAIHVLLLSRSHHTVTDGNWIQLVLVSLVASLEMFIGHTVVFDDIIAAVIFREPLLMIAYLSVFVLILVFTLSIAFLIMPRRLRDRLWLRRSRAHATQNRKNHIFLGVSPYSKMLARSILQEWAHQDRKTQGDIIFVEFPVPESRHGELSIGDLVANIFGRKKEVTLDEELGSDRYVLLKGTLPEGTDDSLAHAIGLQGLQKWLENARTSVYILNDNDQDNFEILKFFTRDKSIQAKGFFYTHEPDSFYSLYANMGKRVRVLNSHYLSLMKVKQDHPELMPVHYVDIARNKQGESLGYVNKGLHSLIVGFGESGQEALRYLYGYGTFAGKDLKRAPMSITLVDASMEKVKGHFLHSAPALREESCLHWQSLHAGSEEFWLLFDQLLDEGLNYIVLAMDKGKLNLTLAIQMLQRAAQKGIDQSKMMILVRVWKRDRHIDDMLAYYNQAFGHDGKPVVYPFGCIDDVWTPDVLSGRSLKQKAICYEEAFEKAGGIIEHWDDRHKRLSCEGGNPLAKYRELMRHQAMEIDFSLYTYTLHQLWGGRAAAPIRDIPVCALDKEPYHFPRKDADYTQLAYLVATEQLHWLAIMLLSGYEEGGPDELLKTYPQLKPYDELEDETLRHISWLSVKAAFSMQEK